MTESPLTISVWTSSAGFFLIQMSIVSKLTEYAFYLCFERLAHHQDALGLSQSQPICWPQYDGTKLHLLTCSLPTFVYC